MIHYQVTMQHTEDTLPMLARKRYDLFGKRNLVSRTIISIIALAIGATNFEQWWGVLLIVYASYLYSSKYASANHTAKKLINGLKAAELSFPQSRYLFRDTGMEVITLPENQSLGAPLKYADMVRIAEDGDYFYIFRDELGGYMIPKSQLENVDGFRAFLEKRTGKAFESKTIPLVKLIRRLSQTK